MKTNFTLLALLLIIATLNVWAQQNVTTLEALPASLNKPVSPLREVLLEKLKTKDKIKLDLFVMSQCPFGVRAEEALLPIIGELGERIEFKLHFVGWLDQNQRIESMHGQAEVDENHRQVVIAKLYPALFSDYLLARAKNYQTNEWKSIAQPLGISPEAIENMMASQEGKQLLREAIRPSMERKIYASPTVFLDDEKYQGRIIPLKTNGIANNAQCNIGPPTAVTPNNPLAAQTGNTVATNSTQDAQCSGLPDNTSCDDGNACTQNDACQSGVCTGTPKSCNDNNGCTIDSCDPTTGSCVYQPVSDEDMCDGQPCDDGNACTSNDVYQNGVCTGTPKNTDDNNACTIDNCDVTTGAIVHTPISCNDNNACTNDSCDPTTGCVNTPKTCDDNNSCTTDFCDRTTGSCVNTPKTCDDNNSCTTDFCDSKTGSCVYIPKNCDDGNPCTIDTCDPITGCRSTPLTAQQIDDNNACTRDYCVPSRGVVHEPIVCNDNNPNTTNSCNPSNGCVFTTNCQVTYPNNIAYVNAAATGSNLGNSWVNAFTNLQNALFAAQHCGVTQIWVAKGTYYPDEGGSFANNDQAAAFTMQNGVTIFGGFPNSGDPTMSDRNWALNHTILSGDLNKDDEANFTNYSDNSYTVVKFNYATPQTILDGLIIRGGNGGSNQNGGGIYNNGSGNGKQSNPTLKNCTLTENQARNGAGIFNDGRQGNSSPTLTNCIFTNNKATRDGGALYNFGGYNGQSNPVLINCLIANNKAERIAGGLFNDSVDDIGGVSSPTLVNCTLANNQADFGVGGIYSDGRNGGVSTLTVTNCIVTGSTPQIGTDNASTTINSSLVSPQNPLYLNEGDGDFRLQACSPAINAGDPSTTSATVGNVDLAGNPRFYNNGRVDMGAYEYQGNAVTQPTASASTTMANVCVGNTINLSVSGGNTFSWAGPSNFNSTAQEPSFVGSSTSYSGLYSVTVGNDNCPLTATATVSVQVNANPVSTPSSNSPICAGQTLQLNATAGGGTYSWSATGYSSGQQNPNRSPATTAMSGVYKLTVSNNSCTATATISVTVISRATASISPSATQIICQGQALNLTASGGGPYSWSGPGNFNSTNAIANINTSSTSNSGIYQVLVGTGVCTATATVSVQIQPSITVSVSFAPVCLVGNPLNLSSSGGEEYRWRGPNSFASNSATPTKAKTVAKDEGVYSVTVTGNGVCTVTSTIRVYYGIGAGEISISNRSPYCKGGPIILTATAAGASSYRWTKQFGTATFTGNPVTITPNAKTSDGGVYTVFVTGQNGCIEKQETLVTVSQVACMGTRLANEEGEEIDMEINAYPNPVTNTLTVEVRLKEASKLSLSLFNSVGKESGTWQLNEEATFHKTELNMSELTGGVYLLQAQAGKQKVVKRVVKIQY